MNEQLISVIIVAGGVGTRMKASIPKQFLMLRGKAMAVYSFELFLSLPYVAEVVVVCDPSYRSIFHTQNTSIPVHFALPGEHRQDSVFNGMQMLSRSNTLVCIHDAARPMVTKQIVERVVDAAQKYGAAAAGMPVKATIKVCDNNQMVLNTPDRSTLWEMQTPQILRQDWLRECLSIAQDKNLTATDDVALMELMGYPVKIVEGSYANIKVTTPEDLIISDQILSKNYAQV